MIGGSGRKLLFMWMLLVGLLVMKEGCGGRLRRVAVLRGWGRSTVLLLVRGSILLLMLLWELLMVFLKLLLFLLLLMLLLVLLLLLLLLLHLEVELLLSHVILTRVISTGNQSLGGRG
ncbi:hypothetical protein E2C01_023323 [Portunus trituberculatus]|uniref:Uncharacterized protein n=1 Tax=Portunus trituberculatus TaxID=210409 RepID=A0A5B7E7P4_PORTR|nr:hypothetical protein [Portunus trituberculatus]